MDKQKDFYSYLEDPYFQQFPRGLDDCIRGADRRMAAPFQAEEKPAQATISEIQWEDDELGELSLVDEDDVPREPERIDPETAIQTALERVRDEVRTRYSSTDRTWLKRVAEAIPVIAARSRWIDHNWLSDRLLQEIQKTWEDLDSQEKAKAASIKQVTGQARQHVEQISRSPETIGDRWNAAIRTLPQGVGGKIATMLIGKKRDAEYLHKKLEQNQRTKAELGFLYPDTVWTDKLQQIVNQDTWMKDIDEILMQEGLSRGQRGTFWCTILEK